MKKVYEKFCKFEQALAIFLLSLITVLVFAAALTRTFGFPINWAQDVALIAFAWLVFIGGDISVRNNRDGGACFRFRLPLKEERHEDKHIAR